MNRKFKEKLLFVMDELIIYFILIPLFLIAAGLCSVVLFSKEILKKIQHWLLTYDDNLVD